MQRKKKCWALGIVKDTAEMKSQKCGVAKEKTKEEREKERKKRKGKKEGKEKKEKERKRHLNESTVSYLTWLVIG